MYPIFLSGYFDLVITFEPVDINFHCLSENIKEYPNIIAHKAALNTGQKCSMSGWDKNTGCYRVAAGSDVTGVAIDDLSVGNLTFIQLDIEGSEVNALDGSARTIDKFKPVIMVERRGHGPDPQSWLLERGYRQVLSKATDTVYIYGEHICRSKDGGG